MVTVKFNDKDSYKDWGLVLKPKDRPLPVPKTTYIDIEGKDGYLDLTTSLTGDVKYQNVSYSLEFTLVDRRENWENKLYEISTYLHGKKMNVIFSDDPDWYCIGRVSLNELTSNKSLGVISLDCNFEPYRMKVQETVIREEIIANKVIALTNSRKWVMPIFKAVSPNFYNVNDLAKKSEQVSNDEEGWITATFDNSAGTSEKYLMFYTNNMELETSRKYDMFVEIKEISGTGVLIPISRKWATPQTEGQFPNEISYSFENLNAQDVRKMVVTTLPSFDVTKFGLRTIIRFKPQQSGSITFRLSVFEHTDISESEFEYEPFIEANAIFNINGNEYSFSGTLKTPDIILKEEGAEITLISGEGNIRISYREGKL